MMETIRQVSFADIAAASERLAGVARQTPVLMSETVDARIGATAVFKCENLQRSGAFKFRGAYNAIAALPERDRSRGVVSYSSGNHAQALALAGRLMATSTTIVMPRDAPAVKMQGVRRNGGEIIFYDRYTESRETIGKSLARARGSVLIPPYDHPDVIAGQGTATQELIAAAGRLDRLFVPLGGGGLLAGAALAVRELCPDCRVIGVEPEAGDDGRRSFHAGRVIHIDTPHSIADGALVTHVGAHNFPIIQALVSDIVTVTDAQLIETMRILADEMKLLVEPTGCLGAAALISRAFHAPGERIGVLLSGGNIDLDRFASLAGTGQ